MRLIFVLVLIAGLGLAGSAVYMARTYIGAYEAALVAERQKNAQEPAVAMEEIWVANRTIAYGEVIAVEDVRLVAWPADALPEAFFGADQPVAGEDIAPRVATRQIEKNEALMDAKVSAPGGDAGITSRLAPGQRAFAVKVDVATGVSGFLRPGDRVDVYWTGRVGNGEVTKLIETGLDLIAVDQTADMGRTDATIARTVTVAASPQVVAALAQAQSSGRLSLSLIGTNDKTIAEAIEVDQRSLLGIEEEVAQQVEAPAPKQVCSIRTRRGAEVAEIPIPCSN
ncbi:pilus assembly protein CpaB [Roseivivax halodurans JCM 10272]|uniref:Pilus assembly protein CpaB n=1 Tax=Roseivivax halodurans JCM 10272 TaxID=1449350 RepID=X7EI51_9RHOB|nr:Flp pilus assembly protein CpaB [Roseivivax halodurans]ETX14813.1 pilus assembly protein CpaB [Roseivivax halodurans JCM 10272]